MFFFSMMFKIYLADLAALGRSLHWAHTDTATCESTAHKNDDNTHSNNLLHEDNSVLGNMMLDANRIS